LVLKNNTTLTNDRILKLGKEKFCSKFGKVFIEMKQIVFLSILIFASCSFQEKPNEQLKEAPAIETGINQNIHNMTTIKFKGNEIHTVGSLPEVGEKAKDFTLTTTDLADKSLSDFKGKNVILNIFPSINTGVCAASVRKFNEDAANLKNTVVLCISKDLPFAQSQFCGAEGIENVVMLSDFKTNFGEEYGVQIADGPLQGLLSRAVVVINDNGQIVYKEQVPEIAQEPNYDAALKAL